MRRYNGRSTIRKRHDHGASQRHCCDLSMPAAVFSLYIVRCADDSLYTGIAADVGKRLAEHESGPRGAKYLRGRRPLKLEYVQEAGDRAAASRLEYRVKRLSRTQKEALIAGHESLDALTGDQVSGPGST